MFPPVLVDPQSGRMKSPWWGVFEKYDPEGWRLYQEWYGTQSKPVELDEKVYELIIVAIDALVAWPSPYIDIHLHEAFNKGASIQEVLETIHTAAIFGGGHALNHGLTTMSKVIGEREAAGIAPPAQGSPRAPAEAAQANVVPLALQDPDTGQLKSPWWGVFEKYEPERWATYQRWTSHLNATKELEKKSTELIVVAIDALVTWHSPYYDIHLHGAFDAGATVGEVFESILTAAQFGGGHALNHGLTTMEKVILERERAGIEVPRRRSA